MQIITQQEKIYRVEADAVVMLLFSDEKPTGELAELDKEMDGKITSLINSGEISGKYREFTMIHTDKIKAPRVLIMGLGKKKDFTEDRIRSMSGRSARILRRIKAVNIAYSSFTGLQVDPELAATCITEGIILGLYHFKHHKTTQKPKKPVEKITIVAKNEEEYNLIQEGIRKGFILAESTVMARNLVNEPGNVMTPTYFADQAKKLAKELSLESYIIDEDDMKEQGMGALLAVSQGSDEPAKMIILKYMNNPGGPVLALVGKGVTFDAGGLSLKGAEHMFRMYSDCAGACAVLGAMSAIARRKLPYNVIAVMPMTENMPSGKAYRPGDIIKSFSGKTIEILNTDAEGRLALADAITMAKKTGADILVDIATLTGGCVTALGYTASGVMTNNQDLCDSLKEAGRRAAENMWQLPLYDDYFAQIYSDVADMENSGGRAASACTAGKFLQQFVGDTPWAHIDIAGTAMIERERTPYLKKPYLPKEGATGVGVRTLYHLTEILANEAE